MNPIYILLTLVMFGAEIAWQIADDKDKPVPPPGKGNPPNKLKDVIRLIMGAIARRLAGEVVSLAKLDFRKMIIDVPIEVKVKKLEPEKLYDSTGYAAHQKEFCKDNLWKNFSAPETAHYKFVSFPGLVGSIQLLFLALRNRWGIANYEELRAVEEQCQLKDLGLGDAFSVMTVGTIMKRKSSFSYCAPVVTYYPNPLTKEREKRLSLQCLIFDSMSPGTYLLVRVKGKK